MAVVAMRAAVIIRMAYAPTYPPAAREWRFRWFEGQVLPRILAQELEPFDLWIWAHPGDRERLEAMSGRIRTFTVDTTDSPLNAHHAWEKVRGLPRYAVQIRVDSDDLIGPMFVRTAMTELRAMPSARAIVTFQPWKVVIETGDVYTTAAYRPDRPSAFLALRQPTDTPTYRWVYSRGHTSLHKIARKVKVVPYGHCWASVHHLNDTTAINAKHDQRVGRIQL